MATLDLQGIRKEYGRLIALDGLDLQVNDGEFFVLLGPSGAGKTTTLKCVAGLEQLTAGRVFIGGRDVTSEPPAARPVSMIFQENNLFAHLDVAANVGLGRSPSLKLDADDRAAVAAALARTGLAGKERRLPRELSGGERQRVALARALVRDRPVLLLDEPFASLGPALRGDMADLVGELHVEAGMTTLLVTHSPEDALRIAPRLVFIEEGRIAADGPTAKLLGPDGPEMVAAYAGSPQR